MVKKLATPSSIIIERTALEMAAVFYESGCNTGLTSKHKTARHYAAHNLEKFVPHAIAKLREMWLDPNTPEAMRAQLHEMFIERISDPMAESLSDSAGGHVLPNLEVAKVIPVEALPTIIQDKRAARDFNLLNSTAMRV